jgi:NAD(P)-dependent dehydrogenase (short-subunit alcohol dehydrogenase family)
VATGNSSGETAGMAVKGRLDGRTAVVTGASRGIGLAIAERLVQEGARVVLTARNRDELESAVTSVGGPQSAIAVAGKAQSIEHQIETIDRALEAFGSVDMLVNNVATNLAYGAMMDVDAAQKTVEVNCIAALSWIRQAHTAWMGTHGGSIVNMVSVAGLRPRQGLGIYGAGKAMLIHLTQGLALELGPGIRVNAVAPSVIKTKFSGPLYEGREDEVAGAFPLGRLGVPDDISGVVAFLLSRDAAWLTGQVIVVDGGVTLTTEGV